MDARNPSKIADDTEKLKEEDGAMDETDSIVDNNSIRDVYGIKMEVVEEQESEGNDDEIDEVGAASVLYRRNIIKQTEIDPSIKNDGKNKSSDGDLSAVSVDVKLDEADVSDWAMEHEASTHRDIASVSSELKRKGEKMDGKASRALRESAREAKIKMKKLRESKAGEQKKDPASASEVNLETCEPKEGSCERNNCTSKECAVRASSKCLRKETLVNKLKNENQKLFHHLTKGEHVCMNCYNEIHKPGRIYSKRFAEWKVMWAQESRCIPTVRFYVQDQLLSFWLQCWKCSKFRKLPKKFDCISVKQIKNYQCGNMGELNAKTDNFCGISEDERATEAFCSSWIHSVSAPPLLHSSPVRQYIDDEYFFDELGMSPVNSRYEKKECKTTDVLKPFNIPNEPSKAFCLRPDVMEYDELFMFPEYSLEPICYLALRNLIVALWNLNPFEYLTIGECKSHILCRGLARVWYCYELQRVWEFMTYKSLINYGIISVPRNTILESKCEDLDVITIGAGISGLGAARQLQSFGAKVAVFEAKNEIGGRLIDDNSLGVTVGLGAQLITGIINNPIILMCKQIGVPYRAVLDQCPLVDSVHGSIAKPVDDRFVDEHFNCILDILADWKQKVKTGDMSLYDQFMKLHNLLTSKCPPDYWNEMTNRLYQWQLGNVEFSCGSELSDVSARNWDQNEAVAQFAGAHALLTEGCSKLMNKLAQGIDVRFNHEVESIHWANRRKILIQCKDGRRFFCDKVLVSVPLAILQRNGIDFVPNLPNRKKVSLQRLGAGLIEKVAVRFPYQFWTSLLKSKGTLDYFGRIPKSADERGLFNMFYDFSSRDKKNESFVLMSYVCGSSVSYVREMSDAQIVNIFIEKLKEMFPNEKIPDAIGYVVTHWGKDPLIGMSYSYVRVHGTGEDYDALADNLDDKVYFCGEGTNRFFPQTMTGAYISGLREAGKIYESWSSWHS